MKRTQVSRRRPYAILDSGAGRPVFAKLFTTDICQEFAKAAQIHRIATLCGHFYAPEPLLVDPGVKLIVWEGLTELVPLRTYLIASCWQPARTLRLMRCCGRALGAIHTGLDLPEGRPWQDPEKSFADLPPELRQHASAVLRSSPSRHFHGDYACANLFVTTNAFEEERLVVIDSSPNHYIFRQAATNATASVYYDIGLLIMTLHSKLSFYVYCQRQLRQHCESFLEAYEEETGLSLDRTTVWACAAYFLSCYRRYQQRRSVERGVSKWAAVLFRLYSAQRLTKVAASIRLCEPRLETALQPESIA